MIINWPRLENYQIAWSTSTAEQNNDQLYWLLWHEDALCIPPHGNSPLWKLSQEEVESFQLFGVAVGHIEGNYCYTAAISSDLKDKLDALSSIGMLDIKDAASENPSWFHFLSRGKQLHHWLNQQYCSNCGAVTEVSTIEPYFYCESCSSRHYPKISPCIIVLIEKGESCLLAHNSNFPEGFYSAIAGFIEAGESIEECIQREVMEEVGVKIHNLRYFGSQPWPFPQQLMVGFHADYLSGEINVDGEELTHAGWFQYNKLPSHPVSFSLSGQLIEAFVKKHQDTLLS